MTIVGINDMPKNARYIGRSILFDTINKQKLIELTYFRNNKNNFIIVDMNKQKFFVSKYTFGTGYHYNFEEIIEHLGFKHSGVFNIPESYDNKFTKNKIAPSAYEATLENILFGITENNIWL